MYLLLLDYILFLILSHEAAKQSKWGSDFDTSRWIYYPSLITIPPENSTNHRSPRKFWLDTLRKFDGWQLCEPMKSKYFICVHINGKMKHSYESRLGLV